MLTEYLIVVASVTGVALIWRALLLDHPALLALVENIPIVGGMLRCGFCTALWLSLAGVALYNPLAYKLALLSWPFSLITAWLVVGVGVLFVRNLIAVLMEGNGVLTHLHRASHKEEH